MSVPAQAEWSLSRDGILWKKVVGKHLGHVTAYIEQLEASAGPVDFLQGLLLDRLAANCLRQQALLRLQQEIIPDLGPFVASRTPTIMKDLCSPSFANLLKYESLLNQAFHRDLILLQTLQKVHTDAPTLAPKKASQSDRSLIEAEADLAVANQAVGSGGVAKSLPQEIELGNDEQAHDTETQPEHLQPDKKNPGYIGLE